MCKLIITVLAVGMLLAFTANVAKAKGFVDNGDGTITDKKTGLMWEIKLASDGSDGGNCDDPDQPDRSVHCVNNTYSWSSSFNVPDGGAFIDFLGRLNNCTSSFGSTVNGGFAGYCDWRLPQIDELRTILDCSQGSPCINPIFGPTAAAGYWSATTNMNSPFTAWGVNFFDGFVFNADKDFLTRVRAVRTGP